MIFYRTKFQLSTILCILNFIIYVHRSSAKKYDIQIERLETIAVNPKYVSHFAAFTRRRNRNSPYSLTANMTFVYPLYNNVSISMEFFEKVNSEYKVTPLAIRFPICEWLKKDKLILPIFARFAPTVDFTKCPLHGTVLIEDLIIKSEDAPTGFWPFERNRLDIEVSGTTSKVLLFKAEFYMKVVEKPDKSNVPKKG